MWEIVCFIHYSEELMEAAVQNFAMGKQDYDS